VSAVMNLRIPLIAGNFLTSCKPVSFSRRTLHHGVSKQVSNVPVLKLCVYHRITVALCVSLLDWLLI